MWYYILNSILICNRNLCHLWDTKWNITKSFKCATSQGLLSSVFIIDHQEGSLQKLNIEISEKREYNKIEKNKAERKVHFDQRQQ